MADDGSVHQHRLIGELRPDALRDELLHEVFAETVARSPTNIALICGETKLTYAELDRAAGKVAAWLHSRDLGRGSFVGLWMSRSSELHVVLLGILKSGAAYIPLDADAPADRVATSLGDCSAPVVIVDAYTAAEFAKSGIQLEMTQMVFAHELLVQGSDLTVPAPRVGGADPKDPAYAIYTSGSTGKPKGIVIAHQNICHYLRSANTIYQVDERDVVFQGSSIAFDLSLEEIFVPYMMGATLWIATRETLQEVDRLPHLLNEAGITVLDTVPTLLALFAEDVPSLRLIILGGEACPPAVVDRWSKPGRRIFNSYGPTEATVVATIAEVVPGVPVTIGKPIPNYSVFVVDENLKPVPVGQQGELLIGGPGVASGYLGRRDLTAEKFIRNPFAPPRGGLWLDPILYRSGDAVSLDESGNLRFHGRIDDQVKIRGFRLELGEIEAKLLDRLEIAQAAVVLRNDNGIDKLVAFVVPRVGQTADKTVLRHALLAQLPSYMVPSHFEVVAEIPRLTSGKVDRKALRVMPLKEEGVSVGKDKPLTATETVLELAAKVVFSGMTAVPLDDDFFLDLGGHSLLAARFLSEARKKPIAARLTLHDVYECRTLRKMAHKLDKESSVADTPVTTDLAFQPAPLLRRFLCGLAQFIALPFILALMTAQWLGIFLSYMLVSGKDVSILHEVFIVLGFYLAIYLGTMVVSLIAKWVILGRTKPGRYPLWGFYYFRWWLAQRFILLLHLKFFQSTPLMRMILRLLGSKVGDQAVIGEFSSGAIDLIAIGEGATIGASVIFSNAEVVGGELVIGTVEIGANAYIGTSCVLGCNSAVGAGTELLDLTSIAPGQKTGPYELWDGSPGAVVGKVEADAMTSPPHVSPFTKTLQLLVYIASAIVLPAIGILPIFPAFLAFDWIDSKLGKVRTVVHYAVLPFIAWGRGRKKGGVLLPRCKEGVYSVYSWFYVRKWIVGLAAEVMLDMLSAIVATVFMRWWYRLMGSKIGQDAEISSNFAGRASMVEIGDKCFIADDVQVADEEVRNGWMHLKKAKTESKVFIGNDGILPAGAHIPEGSLIGIKSKPPPNEDMSPGCTFFGSPPIKLPVRQKFDGIQSNWTFEPSTARRVGRAVFEALSRSLPTALYITFGTFSTDFFELPSPKKRLTWLFFILEYLAVSVGIPIAMTVGAIAFKWLMMGHYCPREEPMWSWWAMKTESVAVLYNTMGSTMLLDHLRGTPFLPWVLRLFGVKIGEGCWLDTTDMTEFDCVEIGNFVSLNATSAAQTHLYEDRVMKVGRIVIGNGVSVAGGSTILYNTEIGDFARLGLRTIVMKGESIPANTEWAGAPAQPEGKKRF